MQALTDIKLFQSPQPEIINKVHILLRFITFNCIIKNYINYMYQNVFIKKFILKIQPYDHRSMKAEPNYSFTFGYPYQNVFARFVSKYNN